MYLIDLMMEVIGVFVSVAFFTLLERKIMSYAQFRKGPYKVFILGLFQPFSDALKLLNKEAGVYMYMNMYMYLFAPMYGMMLMVFLWIFFPSWFVLYGGGMEMVLFFSVLSFSPYFLFFCGYGSFSSYSMVGFVRSISQSISYEVSLLLFLLMFVFLFMELSFANFQVWEEGNIMIFFFLPLFLLWIFLSMAESNRSPFDFSEGESELVSGFNVEYGGGLFSVIFIVEYGMIILMSFLGSLIFFGSFYLLFFMFFFIFIYIWVRSCFPRFRYDFMMMFSWMVILPIVLFYLIFLIEFC